MQLRVLTYNVWFEQVAWRWQEQVSAIRALKPDVLCLQEVQSMDVANRFREAFGSDYECASFAGRLSAGTVVCFAIFWGLLYSPWALLAYLGVVSMRAPGAALAAVLLAAFLWWSPGQSAGFLIGNRTGLLLFVRRESATSIRKSSTLFREWVYDYLNWVRPRGFLTVDAYLQISGKSDIPLRVITSHLDQVPAQPVGRGRVRQAKEMLEHVSDFEGIAVLAGDLNCTRLGVPGGTSCGTYELISEQMSDAWQVNSEPCVTWDQINNPLAVSKLNDAAYGSIPQWQQQVDYVFWKRRGCGRARCSSCETVFKDPVLSDHYGVLAVLDIVA